MASGGGLRARLRTADTDLKRAAFVIAGVCVLMFAAGLTLFVATGTLA